MSAIGRGLYIKYRYIFVLVSLFEFLSALQSAFLSVLSAVLQFIDSGRVGAINVYMRERETF